MSFEIDVSDSTNASDIDLQKLKSAIEYGLQTEGVASAILSVSVVSNADIHRLNREHLQHDYPTDVISFQLDWRGPSGETPQLTWAGRSKEAAIEGEVVVSVDFAREMAVRCGWDTQGELTLYAVHGMLHICGYDDLSQSEKDIMRSREQHILHGLGLSPVYPDDDSRHNDSGGEEPPGNLPGHEATNDTEPEGRQ